MDKELEQWKEKCHQLTLKLNSQEQIHRVEVEFHKEETASKEQELKSFGETLKNEFKCREKKLQEQINDLNDYLQKSQDEGNILKGQLDQLQRTVEQYKTMQMDRYGRNEQNEAVRIREEQLTQELKSARHLLEGQQSKIHTLTQFSEQHKETISELKEEIESKDICIKQLQCKMRTIETEREEEEALQQALKMQNHFAEEEVSDPSKRGNSLFSELEERRVRVEDELKRLRDRIVRLTVENVDLKSSLERGDCRSAIIVTQLQIISKSEADLIQSLRDLKQESECLFEKYSDRLDALRNEYNRKLLQFRNGLDPDEPQPNELETIRAERDRLLAQKISLDRELFDCRKELKFANQQKITAEANLKIIRVKMQALQDQISKSEQSRYKTFSNNNSSGDNGTLDSSSSPSRNDLNNTVVSPNLQDRAIQEFGDDDGRWLHQSILDDTTRVIRSRESYVPKSESAGGTIPEAKIPRKPRTEEIPDCNTQ